MKTIAILARSALLLGLVGVCGIAWGVTGTKAAASNQLEQCSASFPGHVCSLMADGSLAVTHGPMLSEVDRSSQPDPAVGRGQTVYNPDAPLQVQGESQARGGEPDTPFQLLIDEQEDTSRPFSAGNYSPDGFFRMEVIDGSCTSTYTVRADPVPDSAPDGSTPPSTDVVAYIGFGQGTVFFFNNAGVGQYDVTATATEASCDFEPGDEVVILTVTINEGPLDTPFTLLIDEQEDTSRPFSAGDYSPDGFFRMEVIDGSCTSTYTVQSQPVAGSAPDGSTPPNTTVVAYIGFGQGTVFFYDNAGVGDYQVTATATGSDCVFEPGEDVIVMTVTVDEGPNDTPFEVSIQSQSDTSLPFEDPGYTADGSFTMAVADGNCAGTYTVGAQPVAGSGPSGSTPPQTTVIAYIGFGQGSFVFNNAGIGDYEVTVTQTNADCVFDPGVNPTIQIVTVGGAEPVLAIAPTSVDFGEQELNVTSAPASVTLSNSGTGDLSITALTGPDAPFALAGGTCGDVPITIASGDSCTLEFEFTPTSAGAASSMVTLESTSPSSPDTITLQGNALNPIPVPSLSRGGLLALMLLLMGLAVVTLQRRMV
jgi:hypothetical protein